MGVRVEVDGHVNCVLPALVVDPVSRHEEAVQEKGGEREVPRDGVVKHGPLERDTDSGPDLAVPGDGDQDDGEVGGADDAHEESDHPKPFVCVNFFLSSYLINPRRKRFGTKQPKESANEEG